MTDFERIIIAVFIFSAVTVALNGSGIWSNEMPNINESMNYSTVQIEELTNKVDENSVRIPIASDIYDGLVFLKSALIFLKDAVYKTLNVDDILEGYNVPTVFITMISGIFALYAIFWLAKWMTGR